MAFYSVIDNYKKTYKLNNRALGEVVSMNPDQFRMAVKRKSLSGLEIKTLEDYFRSLDEKENKANKTEQSNPAIDSMASELLRNAVFREGIKLMVKEEKEISTNDLLAEMQKMLEKAEKEKAKQK